MDDHERKVSKDLETGSEVGGLDFFLLCCCTHSGCKLWCTVLLLAKASRVFCLFLGHREIHEINQALL